MSLRLMSHWCPDCDRWAFECRCELRADEAREERNQRRRDALWSIENEKPAIRKAYRRGYVITRRYLSRRENNPR